MEVDLFVGVGALGVGVGSVVVGFVGVADGG